MDANFDTNVDDIAEVGVGQALNAVAPISANSLFNAADAVRDLGAVSNTLSMAGAFSIPVPETAICQFQKRDGSPSRKVTEMSVEMKGGKTPMPTASGSPEPRFAWFEVSLGNRGLDIAYSKDAGPSIIECLQSDPIIEAQIAAALRRIHNESIASATPKQAKKLRKSDHIHLGIKADGISDADLSMHIILKALGVPDAPVLQYFSDSEVLDLMREVIHFDTDSVDYIYDGVREGVVTLVKSCDSASNFWVKECVYLHFEFYEQHLKPMSVCHFGNFLHALKHDGEEVALAVLHRIYSGENEE